MKISNLHINQSYRTFSQNWLSYPIMLIDKSKGLVTYS